MRWMVLALALTGCAGFKPDPNYDPSLDLALMGALAPLAASPSYAPPPFVPTTTRTNCYNTRIGVTCNTD